MAEESVKSKAGAKPKLASMSMFEWALGMEQDKEVVGAGRQSSPQQREGTESQCPPSPRPCVRAFVARN